MPFPFFFNHHFMLLNDPYNLYPDAFVATKTQMVQAIQVPSVFISYAVNRNPTAMYNFIQANYPNKFGKVGNGQEAQEENITDMYNFLTSRYDALPTAAQKKHFLQSLALSIPGTAELINWTTYKQ